MKVRPILVTTLCLTVSTLMLSSLSLASGGHGSGRKTKTAVAAKLAPCCADPFLVPDVEGKVKRKTESRTDVVIKDKFEGEVEIPIPSPELGILDEASAQDADIRIILSKDGVPYAECSLELEEVEMEDDDDDEEEMTAEYKVKIEQKMKHGEVVVKEKKGSCDRDVVPNAQEGDTVTTILVTNPDDRTTDISFASGTFAKKK